jgi:MGT family glycosyltransferase
VTHSIRDTINTYRTQWGLPLQSGVDASFSSVAQISQLPAAFDFPRRALPEAFHYVGPLRGPERQDVTFPWHRLDGRRLIYASLGMLFSRHVEVFRHILDACEDLDAQIVISHVGCLNSEQVDALSRKALVVPYAPQYELLKRAHLTITHGGLNTVLDSLSHGVPVVALPCINDTVGVGARLEWTGAGKAVPWSKADTKKLRAAVHEVFGKERFKAAARRVQESIRSAGGLPAAIGLIEQVAERRARKVGREIRIDTPVRETAASS